MIELVAHRDNSWPGAFRLHMKDTGMLLGIGHNVLKLVTVRLKEEGLTGDYRVTFADGSQPKLLSYVPKGDEPRPAPELDRHGKPVRKPAAPAPNDPIWDTPVPHSEGIRETFENIEAYEKQAVDRHGKPVKPAPEPRFISAADDPQVDDPFSDPWPAATKAYRDDFGKAFDKPAPKPKSKVVKVPPPKNKVEPFTLPKLKPIEKRPAGSEKAAVKRAEVRKKKPASKKFWTARVESPAVYGSYMQRATGKGPGER